MTKSKQVVYQDNEYVIFEDGSGGAIMSNEEIEDAEKFDEWFNSLTKEEQDAYIQDLKDHGLLDEDEELYESVDAATYSHNSRISITSSNTNGITFS